MQEHAQEIAKLKASAAPPHAEANGTIDSPASQHPSAWSAMQKEHQAALSQAVSNAQVVSRANGGNIRMCRMRTVFNKVLEALRAQNEQAQDLRCTFSMPC